MARDHFGVKPLYYSLFQNNLIFASEIKSILKFPNFEAALDKQGISELFGIGPAHTSGTCAFKNIHEIKPAHFAVYNRSGLHIERYWKLESKLHTDDFETTCDTVKKLLKDSIMRAVRIR